MNESSSDDETDFRNTLERTRVPIFPVTDTVAMPLTTRGIGMAISYFYYKASKYLKEVPNPPPIYSMFRVSLALVESKLRSLQDINGAPDTVSQLAYEFEASLAGKYMYVCVFPIPIIRILKAMGEVVPTHVFHDNKYAIYQPVMMKNSYTPDGKLIPRPENIIISNLRETVTALADPNVSRILRRQFFACNSIPGAIWDNDFLLRNANEIMPANYSFESDLDMDVRMTSSYCYNLRKYLPKLIHNFKYRYLYEQETLATFVTNEQNGYGEMDLFIPNRQNKTLEKYYENALPIGRIENFYVNSNKLKKSDILEGQVYLLGEVPIMAKLMYPFYCFRDERSMTYRIEGMEYSQMMDKLYS